MFLLDAAVICGVAFLLNQGETQGFGTGVISALAIGFAGLMCVKFVGPFVAIAAIIAASFLVFWAVFGLTPLKSLGGAGIMLVYKVGLAIGLAFLL